MDRITDWGTVLENKLTESNVVQSPNAEAPGNDEEHTRKHHRIKCFLSQFAQIKSGSQTAINRFLDPQRDFRPGDIITLCEGFPEITESHGFKYTARELSMEISCIDIVGMLPGWGTLSLKNVGMLIIE